MVPAQIVRTPAVLACALPGIAAYASPSLEDEVMLAAAREGNVALFRAMRSGTGLIPTHAGASG